MKSTSRYALTTLACASFVLLAGCNQNKPTAQQAPQQTGASVAQLVGDAAPTADAADASAKAPASTYTPPTAAQLISLLAPVAVFPDKLVAQVLAASEYPDEITQANAWLAQNSSLKGDPLQQAIDKQDWDPSVKAIVVFPDVLHQMASNIPWTTALGEAYVNDPNDVMNAIQSLRAQALACNNLKSDRFVTVTKTARNVEPATTQYADEPATYSGPPVIPPPEEVIEIEPAQPDYVYVPYFDPVSYYGVPIDVWPGYYYAWPAPVFLGPTFAFGLGIWIGGFHHWGWGWNHWDIGWGGGFDRHWGGYGWRNASVVYNDRPYIGNSTTVASHFNSAVGLRSNRVFPAGRAGLDPPAGTRTATGLRVGGAAAASAGSTTAAHAGGPVDYNHLSSPHFTSAMAQRGASAAVAARANSVVERPGALASSRYVPAEARRASAYGGAAREGLGREALNNGGYHAQNMPQRSYVSGPERSFTPQRGYVSGPERSFAPQRGFAPQRSFASAPHYAAPGGGRSFAAAPRAAAPGGGGHASAGGGRGGNERHR